MFRSDVIRGRRRSGPWIHVGGRDCSVYVGGADHVGLSLRVSLSRELVSGVDRLDLTGMDRLVSALFV